MARWLGAAQAQPISKTNEDHKRINVSPAYNVLIKYTHLYDWVLSAPAFIKGYLANSI